MLGIAAVVLGTRIALAKLALSTADALSLDALASAAALALAACAIASFAREPLHVRLGLVDSGLSPARIALGALGLVALAHAAEGVVELAGFSAGGLVRFDDALAGMQLRDLAFPFVALALASACGEELFFRGLVQRGLAVRFGIGPAILVASLAFGAAHGDWTHGAVTAVLGGYLGAIAARTGSIRPAIAAHAMNNGLALLEKSLGAEVPGGPIATPLAIVAGVTLAGVALAAIRPPPRSSDLLQSPTKTADEPSDA